MSDARRYAVWPDPREVDRQSPTGLIFIIIILPYHIFPLDEHFPLHFWHLSEEMKTTCLFR